MAEEEDKKINNEERFKIAEEKNEPVDLEKGKSNLESSRDQSNRNKTNKPEQGDENDQNKKPLAFYLYKNFCPCLIIMGVLFLLALALAIVLGVVLAALSLKTNSDESLANSIECPSLQYYNKYQLSCTNQLLNNGACSSTKNCRSDLGLSCQNGKCLCITASQFWNSSICVDYYTYNNQTCSSSSQCMSPMICNFGISACVCPEGVTSYKCDCPARVAGSEYYSSGSTCITAYQYGSSCSANYTCQYLTQNTYCNGTCKCQPLQYFNTNIKYCGNQLTNNQACSISSDCRGDLGLSCISGICSCNTNIQVIYKNP